MDLGSLSASVCVIMCCLLGAARLSSGDNTSCPCPPIPPMALTIHPPQECRQSESTYRYQCVEGYVRRAGSSSLTRCRADNHGVLKWLTPSLECIPDPNNPIPPTKPPPTPPPTTAATNNTSCPCPPIPPMALTIHPPQECRQSESTYRYQCVEGYVRRAETSSLTRCRADNHGVLKWLTPSLECIPDPNNPIPPTKPPPTPPPTTAATTATPTSRQTTRKTSVSEDGGTHNVEPTTRGVEDSGTQTTAKTRQIQNSTVSPRTASSSTTTSPGAHRGKVDSVSPTQEIQNSTVSWGYAYSSTTTSPGVHKGNVNSVTPTVVKNQTRTSTISPSTATSNTISPPGALKGQISQAVGISVSLVIICVIIGIIYLFYRRRSRTRILLSTEEELRPMNCASAVPEGVRSL